MQGKTGDGAFRVLWLGDPRALAMGSWSAGDGLAYATSEQGPPDARWLWNQPGPGPTADLAAAVDLARQGGTDRVGQLLAAGGVRYVVVLSALAQQIVGQQTPTSLPVPADLLPALGRQLDLNTVLAGTGMTVFENADFVSTRYELVGAGAKAVTRPVLPGPPASSSFAGPLSAGTVVAGMAPAGRFTLTVGGRSVADAGGAGWAGRYPVPAAGSGSLGFGGGPWPALALLYSLVLWIGAVALVVGRRRVEEQWWRMRNRRSRAGPPPRSRHEDWDPFGASDWAESPAGTGARP